MLKYKATTWEKFGGHYGRGDTPAEAQKNLCAAMRHDGTRWNNVTGYVLCSWETDFDKPDATRLLIGYGALRQAPEKTISGRRAIDQAIANLE